ncbi:tensin-1-like isoform X2 [Corticium candelabrum]|uniref:tensin-1-like isoform X2 n=1 Tax=Corticium candelabrum TaxID=121492 RepID=UPI002E26B14F|nr:tensin-1-like isoform X2 [Corticium candelabrum]
MTNVLLRTLSFPMTKYGGINAARAPEPKTPKGIMSHIRHKVAKGRGRYIDSSFDLDLTYITERIIAMSFPATGLESTYRNNLEDVARMLQQKHQDKFMVFNLSDRSYDVTKLNFQVLDFGWPDHLAPPLDRLCSICKSIDSWLASDPLHVVVVHCKGGKGRTGTVISAYMHYSNVCQSAEAALDQFAMKRFYDNKLGGVTQPSQRRYVHYFSDLLKNKITLIDTPVLLHTFILHGVPNFDGRNGCRLFLKIYQNLELVHTTDVHVGTVGQERIKITFPEELELAGEVLVKGFHKTLSGRDIVFRCQFHTCVLTDYVLVLEKSELDESFRDRRFPDASRVEFVFSPPLVEIQKGETIRKALQRNSKEIMEGVDLKAISLDKDVAQHEERTQPDGENNQSSPCNTEHYKGPLDESLYAKPGMKAKKAEGQDANEGVSSDCVLGSPVVSLKENRRLSEFELNWYRRVQEAGIPLQVKSATASDGTKLSCHSDWHIEELEDPIIDTRMTSKLGMPYHPKSKSIPTRFSSSSSAQGWGSFCGDFGRFDDCVFAEPQRISYSSRARSLDAVLENIGVPDCRNSYDAWVQSKHNKGSPCLTRQAAIVSDSVLTTPCSSFDQDCLIQLSPAVSRGSSMANGSRSLSSNPFDNLDEEALRKLRLEVEKRKDNPFADVLAGAGGEREIAEYDNQTKMPSNQPPSQLQIPKSVESDTAFITSPRTLSGIMLVDSLPSPEQKKALFFTNRWGGSSQSKGSIDGDLNAPKPDGVVASSCVSIVHASRQEPVGQSSEFAASYASDGPQSPARQGGSKKNKPVLPPRRPEGLNLGKQFWYKPALSKLEAETALAHSTPGTFIVRDSQSLKDSYSLVMKATHSYYDSSTKRAGGVKHFLIMKTEKGFKLKGSTEPSFSSLTQFVLQHSIAAMQLPCKLVIPMKDCGLTSPPVKMLTDHNTHDPNALIPPPKPPLRATKSNPPTLPPPNREGPTRYGADGPAVKLSDTAIEMLTRGAATEITYLMSADVPQCSGPNVVRSAVSQFISRGPLQRPTPVHFEVNISGLLLIDKKQTVFFRRHYPIRSVTYCVVDPDNRKWISAAQRDRPSEERSIFGVVARKPGTMERYVCHLFAENAITQPATAIVSFINRVMELSAMQ